MATVMYKDLEGITRIFDGIAEEPEQTFDPLSEKAMSGIAIAEIAPFRLGIDERGRYGYYKDGADTVTPFNSKKEEWVRPEEWPNLDLLPTDESVIYITVDNADRKCSFAATLSSTTKNTVVEVGDIIDGEFVAVKTVSLAKLDGWSPTVDFWTDVDIDYPVLRVTATSGITNINCLAPYLEDGTKAAARIYSRALEFYIAAPELPKASYIGSALTKHIKFINCNSITSFNRAFIDASNLELVEFENCDNSKMNNVDYMCQGCVSLKNLDFVKDLDFAKCTSVVNAFSYCRSLVEVDFSQLMKNTDNITTWTGFIGNCSSLKKVNFTNVIKQSTSFTSFAGGCTVLEEIDMTGCDASGITSIANFMTSARLRKFILPRGFSMNFSLTVYSRTEIMAIFEQLETITSGATITIGANGLKLLSDADKMVANNKGWLLA